MRKIVLFAVLLLFAFPLFGEGAKESLPDAVSGRVISTKTKGGEVILTIRTSESFIAVVKAGIHTQSVLPIVVYQSGDYIEMQVGEDMTAKSLRFINTLVALGYKNLSIDAGPARAGEKPFVPPRKAEPLEVPKPVVIVLQKDVKPQETVPMLVPEPKEKPQEATPVLGQPQETAPFVTQEAEKPMWKTHALLGVESGILYWHYGVNTYNATRWLGLSGGVRYTSKPLFGRGIWDFRLGGSLYGWFFTMPFAGGSPSWIGAKISYFQASINPSFFFRCGKTCLVSVGVPVFTTGVLCGVSYASGETYVQPTVGVSLETGLHIDLKERGMLDFRLSYHCEFEVALMASFTIGYDFPVGR